MRSKTKLGKRQQICLLVKARRACVWWGKGLPNCGFLSSCLLKCSLICMTFDKSFGRNVLHDQTNEGGRVTLGRAPGCVVKQFVAQAALNLRCPCLLSAGTLEWGWSVEKWTLSGQWLISFSSFERFNLPLVRSVQGLFFSDYLKAEAESYCRNPQGLCSCYGKKLVF